MRKKFGEILIEAGVLNETTVRVALEKQKGSGKRLGQILEEMGRITEKDLTVTLAHQFGLKAVKNLAKHSYAKELLDLIDGETALKSYVFPLKRTNNVLYVAIANPLDITTLDDLRFRTGLRVTPHLSTPSEIQAAIQAHYFPGEIKTFSAGCKILIADDQEFFRVAIKAALDKEGYTTLLAGNGAEAVQMARQHAPDLILLDTVMPHMNGWDTFKALQHYENTRKIPVIALTSRASAEDEAMMLDFGYFDFIAKPFNPVRLMARVKRAYNTVYGAPKWAMPRASESQSMIPGFAAGPHRTAMV